MDKFFSYNAHEEGNKNGNGDEDSDDSETRQTRQRKFDASGDSDDEMANFLSGDVLSSTFKTKAQMAEELAAQAAAAWRATRAAEREAHAEAERNRDELAAQRNAARDQQEADRKVLERKRKLEQHALKSTDTASEAVNDTQPRSLSSLLVADEAEEAKERMRGMMVGDEAEAARRRREAADAPAFKAKCWSCDDDGTRDYTKKAFKSRGLVNNTSHDPALCERCVERAKRRAKLELTRNMHYCTCPASTSSTSSTAIDSRPPHTLTCDFCLGRARRRAELAENEKTLRAQHEGRVATLVTCSIKGFNGMTCQYNCAKDEMKMLVDSQVVWTGPWKQMCVSQTSNRTHYMIKPLYRAGIDNEALLTFFVALHFKDWCDDKR